MSVIYKTVELSALPESGEKYVIYIVGTSLYYWNGTAFILVGASIETGDYLNLTNKPSLNGVTLVNNKDLSDVGINTITAMELNNILT